MHRTLSVVVQLEQGFVDEPVAVPFILLGMDFGQVDGAFDQCPEDARLRHRLPVHLPDPSRRAVGRDDDERHLLVERLRDGGVHVRQRAARRAADGRRLSPVQRQPEGKEGRAPLVRHRVAAEIGVRREGLHDGRVAAAGTEHDFLHAVLLEQGDELLDILFI